MGTATENRTAGKAVPTRDQIDNRYTWNLADLYASEDAWEADFKKVQQLTEKASAFAGRLNESPETLYDCLKARSDAGLIISQLFQYAKLNQDLDNRVSKYQAMTDRAATLASQFRAAFSFVEPELLSIDEKKLLEMANQFPKSDEYDFYIRELIRTREHIRTQEIEELLALSTQATRGPESIFTMLDDADLEYPVVTDEDGNEIQLTKQRYAKLLESQNREIRQAANDGFNSVYKAHINTLGATLGSAVNADWFYARARKFGTSLESALFGDNIPTSVYHSLLDTTEKHLDGLHHYIDLRKRLLEIDAVHTYDLVCPLFPEADYEVEYEQAIEEILEAVSPLGKEYGQVLRNAFGSRWVDVYETAGKASGAFSWGSYSAHPFVLMNYNKTVDNMFTLAHEMGHALHSHLSNSTQPYPKAQYSIFVAEVASTLNEGLLLQHLLKKADSTRTKAYLLNRYIDNTMGTFFNQVLYARFELLIHEEIEKGGALSPDQMVELWTDLTKKYYGPALGVDDYTGIKWARIPHFYMTFYVYQYATSYAASEAVLDKMLAGEKGMVGKYLELLSSGGKDYPINLLKKCDVDMSGPAPFEATLKRFADQVAELDNLAQKA